MAVPAYDGAAAAASILMSPVARELPILFVEGPCEVLLITHHHPDYADRVVPCGGHRGVREAIATIESWEKNEGQSLSVLGLIDRDYGSNSRYRRLTVSNNRDVEVDLYLSRAAERLLREKASRPKCPNPSAIVSEALSALYVVGVVRKFNADEKRGWKINDVPLDKCIKRDGTFLTDKFFQLIQQVNKLSTEEIDFAKKFCDEAQDVRVESVVRGHDISLILGKWLRARLGNRAASETSIEVMEENLRLGSQWSDISKYHWGRRIHTHLMGACG